MQNETMWTTWPLPNAYPYLSSDETADIVVVGGGLTGALCAWHLCQEGHDVLLMTDGLLGKGGTRSSLGLLRTGVDEGFTQLLKRIGPLKALEAYRAMQSAVIGLEHIQEGLGECGFSRKSGIIYTQDAREASFLRGEHQILLRNHFNVEWIDAMAVQRQFAIPMEGALLMHGGVAQVNPYLLTHRLVEDSPTLRVYENTHVTQVRPMQGGILFRTNTAASVRARYAVIATGEPPRSLHPFTLRQRHLGIATLPAPAIGDWPHQSPLYEPGEGLTMRVGPEGSLIACLTTPALTAVQGRRQSRRTIRRAERLKATMNRFSPRRPQASPSPMCLKGRASPRWMSCR